MRHLLLALVLSVCVAAPASASVVVGGKETDRQWPWMVYLDQGRAEIELFESQYCGGSLIAPTWVITAAHCIGSEAFDPLITSVVIGRHAKSDTNSGERIQVRRILVNPNYGESGDDAALVELQRAPAGGPQPLKIAAPGEEGLYEAGDVGTVLGWGNTREGGSASDVLKEAQVPIVSDAECGQAYSAPSWGWNPAVMICAGYPQGGTDTCQGDSGGPLVVEDGAGGFRLVGLTSFGEGCARAGYPGVYAEVAGEQMRTWVASIVPDAIAARSQPPAPPPASPPAPQPAPPAQSAPSTQEGPPPAASQRRRSSRKARCARKARKIKSKSKRRAAVKRCVKRRA